MIYDKCQLEKILTDFDTLNPSRLLGLSSKFLNIEYRHLPHLPRKWLKSPLALPVASNQPDTGLLGHARQRKPRFDHALRQFKDRLTLNRATSRQWSES